MPSFFSLLIIITYKINTILLVGALLRCLLLSSTNCFIIYFATITHNFKFVFIMMNGNESGTSNKILWVAREHHRKHTTATRPILPREIQEKRSSISTYSYFSAYAISSRIVFRFVFRRQLEAGSFEKCFCRRANSPLNTQTHT